MGDGSGSGGGTTKIGHVDDDASLRIASHQTVHRIMQFRPQSIIQLWHLLNLTVLRIGFGQAENIRGDNLLVPAGVKGVVRA